MNRFKDITIIDNLAAFERLISKNPKSYDVNLEVLPGYLEDRFSYLNPDEEIPLVRRRFNSIYFISEGQNEILIGPQHYQLSPHDLVIVPENMVYAASHIQRCCGFFIHFKTEFLQSLLKEMVYIEFPFLDSEAEHILHLKPKESESIVKSFQDIMKEFERPSLEKDSLLKYYLEILLLRIREIYRPLPHPRAIPKSGALHIANNFKHLAEENFLEIREVKQYAEMLNITPGHLSDTVQKALGISPRTVINNLLLSEAKILLTATDISISEIAQKLRFDDQPHFSHFIKHHTGITPKELRKSQ
jgi:AraC family transcriptional regulator, transcriptional activator of pobA